MFSVCYSFLFVLRKVKMQVKRQKMPSLWKRNCKWSNMSKVVSEFYSRRVLAKRCFIEKQSSWIITKSKYHFEMIKFWQRWGFSKYLNQALKIICFFLYFFFGANFFLSSFLKSSSFLMLLTVTPFFIWFLFFFE